MRATIVLAVTRWYMNAGEVLCARVIWEAGGIFPLTVRLNGGGWAGHGAGCTGQQCGGPVRECRAGGGR